MTETINHNKMKNKIIELRKKGLTIRDIQKELKISSPSLVHYHLKKYQGKLDKQTLVFEAIGEISALFMSNPLRGTEQIMPSRELEEIGDRILKLI